MSSVSEFQDGGDSAAASDKEQEGMARRSDPSSSTFDQWLTHHLRKLYEPTVGEPIPADFIRILERKLG